jgi:hypothetical protein
MSAAEDHFGDYRVKFVDVRVNPPGGRRRHGDGSKARRCEHKGCDSAGDCRAPKPAVRRTLEPAPGQATPDDDCHWFCQRHAAEYNRAYDFFDGMTESEIAAFQASAAYGHRQTWRFGGGPLGGARAHEARSARRWRGRQWVEDDKGVGPERPARAATERTRLQLRALDELELPHNAEPNTIRERYGELVKRLHPDSNGGDRSTEVRLAAVIRAYKTLKASGLG